MIRCFFFLLCFTQQALCLIPPKFQWKTINYLWENDASRDAAIERGDFIPENNIPTGIARWKNKLFITVPRLKKGVPSSLNYIYVNGPQEQPLNPYPTWMDAFTLNQNNSLRNSSVVCAFRAFVDTCDRLWTVDNGVSDIIGDVKQISQPSIMVFDLMRDQLLHKLVLNDDVLRDSSIFTSIVVDFIPCKGKECHCNESYAYITDMGSNAVIVYNLKTREAWRVEHPYFQFDPLAGKYRVGGVNFIWEDGVSSATLTKPNDQGFRDYYFHPTSSTKQFKMSTKLLKDKNTPYDENSGVQVVGDKGEMCQATACDYDVQNNVLFYTQLSKNGVGCWNVGKPFNEENTPLIFSDCNMMEYPSDIKVDYENNLWILSNRQSRFLYGVMDFSQVNFRVMTAPTTDMIRGTACEKQSPICRAFSSLRTKTLKMWQ